MKKKSKTSSGTKRRDRSKTPNSGDDKSKRSRHRSGSAEKVRAKEGTKSTPRKSRWQDSEPQKTDVAKCVSIPETEIKKEKSGPSLRIKDLLPSKEKIVDLLFETVTGAALQKIIPDYLKKRSPEDLKKLCLEQIKDMSDEVILQIISEKYDPDDKVEDRKADKIEVRKVDKVEDRKVDKVEARKIDKGEDRKVDKVEDQNVDKAEDQKSKLTDKPEGSNVPKEIEIQESKILEKKPEEVPSVEASDSLQSDVLELHTTATEFESIFNEENQIPVVIKEVAKDLILPERDAELLELEMRARAIRSLLKARCQVSNEENETVNKE